MGDAICGVLGVALVLFLFCLCGYAMFDSGRSIGREEMQAEAIERGFAEYDSKTAEWKWNP